MATERQKMAARRNIRKAQKAWGSMSSRARSRARPGAKGGGGYYHVEVRPRREFKTFRTQDVGKPGGIQRVAGKRSSGSWGTQKWLIAKSDAHEEGGRLVGDTAEARRVLEQLGAAPMHVSGDRFKARPRTNVPEARKPTPAQKRARQTNIKKAQSARHKRSA